jgi:peptidoglycan/LPS O-acetylase OafA/YrhL
MLLLGLALVILAGYLFYWPSTPFIGGPSLSVAGATLGYPLFAAGCACVLSASLNWEQWSPKWRVPGAAAIATISYSLYLSHKLTSHAMQLWLDPADLVGISGLAVYYGSSIAVAAVLWALIERPPLLLRNRLLERRLP